MPSKLLRAARWPLLDALDQCGVVQGPASVASNAQDSLVVLKECLMVCNADECRCALLHLQIELLLVLDVESTRGFVENLPRRGTLSLWVTLPPP